MNLLFAAAGLGAVAGSRSLLSPALLARARGTPLATPLLVLAAAELLADKLPAMPSRTEPLPLAGRLAIGGLVGALLVPGQRLAGALAGASSAALAAHLLSRTRVWCSGRRIPNAMSGVCEDAGALLLGTWLASLEHRERHTRDVQAG